MEEKKFYDIHFHAMNLSHPYLGAFIQRLSFSSYLVLSTVVWLSGAYSFFNRRKVRRIKNLLSIMENDIGSMLLLVEEYLGQDNKLYKDGKLQIGGNEYSKFVVTPLIMDFGYDHIDIEDSDISYSKRASRKPVVKQVIDLFNGIKNYRENSEKNLFEVYPFLGLNPKNYLMESADAQKNTLPKMLDKYFSEYRGSESDLYANFGEFNGDISTMGSNFFAGIKLYPPLGFDPWPNENCPEMEKVRYLYQYCSEKRIPITVHCSDGGFRILTKKLALEYTEPTKWEKVLESFPELKLNLAHFGEQSKFLKIFPEYKWRKAVVELIIKYDNVFADFSYRGVDKRYYDTLKKIIENEGYENCKKLMGRILFGSDFMINLLSMDLYNDYLRIYSESGLTDGVKDQFGHINPRNFLFSQE